MEPINNLPMARKIMIDAMRTRTQIDILYVRANESTTVRTVEPFGFTHNNDGDAYVRSMDHKSGEIRSWRLDRIIGYASTDRPFELDPPTSAELWTDPEHVAA